MEVSLLRDHEYVDKVNETVARTYGNNLHLNNKGLLWDLIRPEVRSMAVS